MPFPCPHCDAAPFAWRYLLDNHQRTAHPEQGDPVDARLRVDVRKSDERIGALAAAAQLAGGRADLTSAVREALPEDARPSFDAVIAAAGCTCSAIDKAPGLLHWRACPQWRENDGWLCLGCGERFISAELLSLHQKLHHEFRKKKRCAACGVDETARLPTRRFAILVNGVELELASDLCSECGDKLLLLYGEAFGRLLRWNHERHEPPRDRSISTECKSCKLWWAPWIFGPALGENCPKCGAPVTENPTPRPLVTEPSR